MSWKKHHVVETRGAKNSSQMARRLFSGAEAEMQSRDPLPMITIINLLFLLVFHADVNCNSIGGILTIQQVIMVKYDQYDSTTSCCRSMLVELSSQMVYRAIMFHEFSLDSKRSLHGILRGREVFSAQLSAVVR